MGHGEGGEGRQERTKESRKNMQSIYLKCLLSIRHYSSTLGFPRSQAKTGLYSIIHTDISYCSSIMCRMLSSPLLLPLLLLPRDFWTSHWLRTSTLSGRDMARIKMDRETIGESCMDLFTWHLYLMVPNLTLERVGTHCLGWEFPQASVYSTPEHINLEEFISMVTQVHKFSFAKQRDQAFCCYHSSHDWTLA